LLSFLDGPRAAARNLLNFATYYKMKERAGIVGRTGANQVLRTIRASNPNLRLHLIGHSFGGRLVTAAALGPDGAAAVQPQTLTLLQAAFSHYGFAQHWDGVNDGLFRRVVTDQRVAGPVLITYTRNDTAVGLAYPIASQIARQTAAWVGDKNDRYGGIGSNGAQKTPEAVDEDLLVVGSPYAFQRGQLHNLKADAFIANHSDICKNEVAYAIQVAISRS
jgi:pimeloyl-ACP methyl ester carboxylesterase